MREHQYKTHSLGQYFKNFVDGEAQHEIHILYSTHTNTKMTQMFQEIILTPTSFIFLFYFKKKRKHASCNH